MSGERLALSLHYQMQQAKKVKALTAENSRLRAEVERLRAMVGWRPIETVPLMRRVLLCNHAAKWVCVGTVYPDSGKGYATHWMPFHDLPNPRS